MYQESGEKLPGERTIGMPPSPAQARLAEFLETAERLKNERATAGGVLETVEATPPAAWPTLATRPEFQTNAALERLGEEVRRRLDRNPREALALAELATTIADGLPEKTYPAVTMAQIRAMAWKDRANALRVLGRLADAIEALSRAEDILERHVVLGADRAVVDMVKALIFVDTGKVDDARSVAIACSSIFLAHGDLSRALQAGEIEGYVLFEKHQYRDAQVLFTSLLEVARATNDTSAEARCENNLGHCLIYLDDFKTANIHFSNAIAKMTDLGQPLSAIRAQWGAGQVLLAKGQTENGIQHLSAARASFAQNAMLEEAALCGLAIAESLLTRGDEVGAREIVRSIARELQQAPHEHRITETVTALEQMMDDSQTPVDAVRHAYTLIEATQSKHA
jgi:tetratricopeptide (TPR) repeat protein